MLTHLVSGECARLQRLVAARQQRHECVFVSRDRRSDRRVAACPRAGHTLAVAECEVVALAEYVGAVLVGEREVVDVSRVAGVCWIAKIRCDDDKAEIRGEFGGRLRSFLFFVIAIKPLNIILRLSWLFCRP